MKKLSYLLIIFFSLYVLGFSTEKKPKIITVATAPIDGVFYPLGIEIAETIRELGYNASAESTAGSGENIDKVLNEEAELGIVMFDSAYQAYHRIGGYKSKINGKNLATVMELHSNYTQIITLKSLNIKKFQDLKGKKVGVGVFNSGVDLNARLLYKAHNMSYKDSTIIYATPGELIEQLKNEVIDVIFLTNTIPNELVLNLSEEKDIEFVEISEEGNKNLKINYPFFFEGIIPKGIYKNEKDVKTIGVTNFLVTNKKVDEDIIYKITKEICEKSREILIGRVPLSYYLEENKKKTTTSLPFHKGAERYYKEVEKN